MKHHFEDVEGNEVVIDTYRVTRFVSYDVIKTPFEVVVYKEDGKVYVDHNLPETFTSSHEAYVASALFQDAADEFKRLTEDEA